MTQIVINTIQSQEKWKIYNMAVQKEEKKPYLLPNPDKKPEYIHLIRKNTTLSEPQKAFLRWTRCTAPSPHEKTVFGKDIEDLNLESDAFGNWYLLIKNLDGSLPKTMFTCHLDTADAGAPKEVKHSLFQSTKTNDIWVQTHNTVLGADCKAGTVVMEHMINHHVPGLYYFFQGEEVGLKGSRALAEFWKTNQNQETKTFLLPELDKHILILKCISWDRKGEASIIAKQSGNTCVSQEFIDALSQAFFNTTENLSYKRDDTGSYTDSYAFLSLIPECTNLSVGYYNQHTHSETQNLTYLDKLCNAAIQIDWEEIPAKRVPINPTQGKYTSTSISKTVYGSNYYDRYEEWDEENYAYAGSGVTSYKPKSTGISRKTTKVNFDIPTVEQIAYCLLTSDKSKEEVLVTLMKQAPSTMLNLIMTILNTDAEGLKEELLEASCETLYENYGI